MLIVASGTTSCILSTYLNTLSCLSSPRRKLVDQTVRCRYKSGNVIALDNFWFELNTEVWVSVVAAVKEMITFYFELGIIVNRLIIASIHTSVLHGTVKQNWVVLILLHHI